MIVEGEIYTAMVFNANGSIGDRPIRIGTTALKQHSCIEVSGEIGDNRFRKKPKGELELCNKFGREFLEQTLPFYARFDPNSGDVQIRTDASNEVTRN